ncbi:MAG TPA: RnfABCDGE type electron transport complex subunit B [Oscillospiraceae bacterium]|nr:RnfABCDGE type electron transport complex subunit B [Oscillospiraceae bacterium]
MILPAVICLGGLGLIFGCLLAYAAQKFAVEVDPKIAEVQSVLPGANCGACGYAGCEQFAKAVAAGEAPVAGCKPGRAKVAAQIAEILGTEVPKAETGKK